nr:MAG TPA: hypothetical protein [Caudoviricetes sp.]
MLYLIKSVYHLTGSNSYVRCTAYSGRPLRSLRPKGAECGRQVSRF